MVRTPCCEKTGIKKGAWTPEEDKKLSAYIRRYGHWNWRELPKYAGLSRCGKSCRLRWVNYLKPNIKRGNYSQEEEELIIKLHESLGNKWSAIAAKLPGRTDNEIKNHWHSNLKKHWEKNPTASEAKLNSNETSQCEASKKRELEPNTSLHDAHTHQIIESSSLSSQPSSSEFSSSTDSAAVNATNSVAEDTVISPETFVEPSGNFWTEPYFAGNSYIQEDFPVTFVDPGSMFPFSTVSLGEYFCSYGSDGMDWFN